MGLPEFNLQAKGMSSDKQMAMMRSYLGQLKDETETQLFDIKWDNLSSTLKKKIDNLENGINSVSEYSQLTAQNITANYVTAKYLSANYITSEAIETTYLKTSELDAEVANLGYVYASYVDTKILEADFIKAGYLSSDDLWVRNQAFISKLTAKVGAFGYLVADDITADKIRAKVSGSASSYIDALYVGDVKVQSGISMAVGDRQNGFFTPHYLSGSNLYVLAWSPTQSTSLNSEEPET